MINKSVWRNIEKYKEYHITYLLYKEGKSVDAISIIRGIDKKQVEKHIIKSKIEINRNKAKEEDFLVSFISMSKEERLKILSEMSEEEKCSLADEVYKRYIKFKNHEDRMILIWLIGELKNKKLLPFLKMELSSNNVNFRRLSCSALGKIKSRKTKSWLEDALKDSNPQVRQYAAKALSFVGDEESIVFLKSLLRDEKEYVRRSANLAIDEIEKYL